MAKLKVIDGKQTSWEGLWWHPEYAGFSSATISLAQLREFKGNVRLYVRKNKFYQRGGDRPNYCFCLKDSSSPTFTEIGIEDDATKVEGRPYKEDGVYYTEDGERLYTYDEVQYAINCAAEDGQRGYGYGENIVSDYL